MTDYLAAIPLLALPRLHCRKCRARMAFACIGPGPSGFELRTFECTECDFVEKIAIDPDLTRSGNVGWLVGELQPPA